MMKEPEMSSIPKNKVAVAHLRVITETGPMSYRYPQLIDKHVFKKVLAMLEQNTTTPKETPHESI